MKNHKIFRIIWLTLTCTTAFGELHATASCSLSSKALAFDSYFASDAAPLDRYGSVAVSCTDAVDSGAGVTVVLDIGGSANGPYNDRRMASGENYLRYAIYSDSGRTANWGGTNKPMQATGSLTAHVPKFLTFPLYGRIPPQQNAPAGHYFDSVAITVNP